MARTDRRHLGSGIQRGRHRDRGGRIARAGLQTARSAPRRSVRRAAGQRRRPRLLQSNGRRRPGVHRRSALQPRADKRADRGPHTVLRRLLHQRRIGGYPAGGDSGVRPRHPRLPAAVAGGHGGVRDRPAAGHRVQDRSAGRPGRRAAPIVAPSASICATTGRQRCGTADSIRPSRPRGSPRDC